MPGPEPSVRTVLGGLHGRLLAIIAPVARLFGSGGDVGGAVSQRRAGLLAYTAASIVTGVGMLAWTTMVNPLWPAIDPGLPGTALSGPTGGLLLWLMFGLLGSLRVLRTPDGGTMTFHMPFIGAAMVLGGPTAGAWVAFLSTIERRELESQPWYGILANHAVLAVAAVLGGLMTGSVARLIGADGPGGAAFVAALAGILVFAALSTSMGALTVMLRDGLTRHDLLGIVVGQVGRITALEIALALILAFAYPLVGWWTPLAIGAFVLVIWPSGSKLDFSQLLDRSLGRLRRGVTVGATLMYLDIDGLTLVNDRFGAAVRDDVLREAERRLREKAHRPDDIVGHQREAEFALFLPGLANQIKEGRPTAVVRAEEIQVSLGSPYPGVPNGMVCASIGVVVLRPGDPVPARVVLLQRAEQVMLQAKRDGCGVRVYDPSEPAPFY